MRLVHDMYSKKQKAEYIGCKSRQTKTGLQQQNLFFLKFFLKNDNRNKHNSETASDLTL
uniref:Uncharacterized protein n=1 Tax=Anguilla anguilla TaxID=7936 RepID=A0A0E9WN06_ANGAN